MGVLGEGVKPRRGGSGRRRWSRQLAGLLLVVGLSAAGLPAASGAVRLEVADGPFYARITRIGDPAQIFEDDGVVVVVFYRPPSCVPERFDLLSFFDVPGAFFCGPPTVGGFTVWENGPAVDPAPRLAISDGLGAVPVWFVSRTDLNDAIAGDDALTIVELEAMPSLVTGVATRYHEVLQPHGTAPVPMTSFSGSGTLDDGRTFRMRGLFIEGVTIQTEVRFS